MAQIAGIFAGVWVAVGLIMLWFYLAVAQLSGAKISTLMFLYLIYSAMTTIMLTRTRDHFWEYAPSKLVGWVVFLNIGLATVLALAGLVTAQVSWVNVLVVMGIVVSATLVLDQVKISYYRQTGILGTEQKDV